MKKINYGKNGPPISGGVEAPSKEALDLMAERRRMVEAMARQQLALREREKRQKGGKGRPPIARIPRMPKRRPVNADYGLSPTPSKPTRLPIRDIDRPVRRAP